jgi:hypothetical protein
MAWKKMLAARGGTREGIESGYKVESLHGLHG